MVNKLEHASAETFMDVDLKVCMAFKRHLVS